MIDLGQVPIQPYAGQRILDQLEREPEATYEQYTARWEDLGSPSYQNPHSVPPGHIVGVTWDSAIPKFGIDRWAGVASDYGNPDKFKFQLDLQGWEWKGQRLTAGLPVLRTTFERSAVRLEVEQFAYPLLGPPPERRGDIAMVLLQKVRATALDGTAQTVRLNLRHERSPPDSVGVADLGPTARVEETDVVIVGGGLAGLRLAVGLSGQWDVAIVSKVHPVRSHSGAAQGGINAALGNAPEGRDDSPARHAFDTIKGSDYLADQSAVVAMCELAPELIVMSGSVELAPLVGLTDLIVDLVQTGATLRENGLVELRTILESQAVLIANRASYRLRAGEVRELIDALANVMREA